MKQLIYTTCLLLISLILTAQIDKNSCYTIVFTNGYKTPALLVAIDSVTLTFQECDQKSTANKKVSLLKVDTILNPTGTPNSLSLLIADSLRNGFLDEKRKELLALIQPSGKTWQFTHRYNKTFFSLNSGQEITAFFYDLRGRFRKVRGRLSNLTREEIVIIGEDKVVFNIPKEQVKKMKVYTKKDENLRRIGMVLLVLGSIMTFVGASLSLPSNYSSSGNSGSDETKGKGVGIIGFLVMLFSFVFIAMFPSKSILHYPFSDDWEITSSMDKEVEVSETKYRP